MAQLKLVASTCESPTPRGIANVAGRLDEMLSRYLGDAIISAVADAGRDRGLRQSAGWTGSPRYTLARAN